MNSTPTWQDELESQFNQRYGFGIWDKRVANVHEGGGVFSSSVLEFFKSFIAAQIEKAKADERARSLAKRNQ